MERVGIIERAFQLARTSESLKEVRRKLQQEGYVAVDAHLAGAQIKRDLKARLTDGQSEAAMDAPTKAIPKKKRVEHPAISLK